MSLPPEMYKHVLTRHAGVSPVMERRDRIGGIMPDPALPPSLPARLLSDASLRQREVKKTAMNGPWDEIVSTPETGYRARK